MLCEYLCLCYHRVNCFIILILEGHLGHLIVAPGMESPQGCFQWRLELGDSELTIKVLGHGAGKIRGSNIFAEVCIHNADLFLLWCFSFLLLL